jgi:nitroreductase
MPVEKDKLDLVLEAGRIAPAAANKQPQRILVITDTDGLKKWTIVRPAVSAPRWSYWSVLIRRPGFFIKAGPGYGLLTVNIQAWWTRALLPPT